MAQETKYLVFFTDGGYSLTNVGEDEELEGAMAEYVQLLEEALENIVRQPQFRHVELVTIDTTEETPEDVPSKLCIGFANSVTEEDGERVFSEFSNFVDIQGALTGKSGVPESLKSKVDVAIVPGEESGEEYSMLEFKDEELAQTVEGVLRRSRTEKSYNKFQESVGDALTQALLQAMALALPEGEEPEEDPVDPYDVIQLVAAQIVTTAGISLPAPSLLNRGAQLLGNVAGAPRNLLRALSKRIGRTQRLWWRLEDFVIDGGKFALKAAVKAARPVLIAVVLHRALRTISNSRSLEARMARLPEGERIPFFYRQVLGDDWEAQMEEDLVKAMKDVNDGYITDDINREKRKVSAAMLRRLELEDWDKERMKNYYLASFGGLKWFDFMEQALHNPLFITARGWTDPIVNWVGENQTFPNDLPATKDTNVAAYALDVVEKSIGRSLTIEEKARILNRVNPTAAELMAGGEGPLGAVLTPERLAKVDEVVHGSDELPDA